MAGGKFVINLKKTKPAPSTKRCVSTKGLAQPIRNGAWEAHASPSKRNPHETHAIPQVTP